MKKRMAALLLAAGMTALGGGGIAAQAAENFYGEPTEASNSYGEPIEASDFYGEPAEASDFYGEITAANDTGVLQEKYGIIACRYQFYGAEEIIRSAYAYADSERYIYELEGSFYADKDGEAYGYDEDIGLAYRYLFLDDSYREFKEKNCSVVAWDASQAGVLSGEVRYGTEYLEVETWQDADFYRGLLEAYGLQAGAEARVRSRYVVDAETMEIAGMERYLEAEDGSEQLFEKAETVYNATKIEPDMGIREQIFSDDQRTVTVIADAGSESERSYVQTVGNGCGVNVYLGSGYEQQVYTDAACTQPFAATDDNYGDLTVYVRTAGR